MKLLKRALQVVALDKHVAKKFVQLHETRPSQEDLEKFIHKEQITDPEEISELMYDLRHNHGIMDLKKPSPTTRDRTPDIELSSDLTGSEFIEALEDEFSGLGYHTHYDPAHEPGTSDYYGFFVSKDKQALDEVIKLTDKLLELDPDEIGEDRWAKKQDEILEEIENISEEHGVGYFGSDWKHLDWNENDKKAAEKLGVDVEVYDV